MVIVKVYGGLGNQLFQYAFARELAEYGKEVFLDLSWFRECNERDYQLNNFNISINELEEKQFSKFKKQCKFLEIPILNRHYYISEEQKNLDKKLGRVDNVIVDGYWQSEKYFAHSKQKLVNEIILKKFSELTKKWESIIKSNKMLSVHVRRGDYLFQNNVEARGGICTHDYYKTAIDYLNKKVQGCKFLFFSDDIEWVKQNFKGENIYYFDALVNDAESLYLMSLCEHHIIANSTYSWWGAWLNDNDSKIVIAPRKWNNTKDMSRIYLDKWTII